MTPNPSFHQTGRKARPASELKRSRAPCARERGASVEHRGVGRTAPANPSFERTPLRGCRTTRAPFGVIRKRSYCMKFVLSRLTDYSSEAILSELQRVASLVETPYMSKAVFDEHSRVHSATIVRRFNGWENALTQAGLSHRIQPVNITEKMRNQRGKEISNADLILELQRVAALAGVDGLKTQDIKEHSSIDPAIVRRRFGSWNKGLKEAGLRVPARARRYTDEECFENLLNLWVHLGRAPFFRELEVPPSVVGGTAYVKRWGTFNKALLAFIAQTETDTASPSLPPQVEPEPTVPNVDAGVAPGIAPRVKRKVPLGIRFTVLKRDCFKCVLCGVSPATSVTCNLHVDHIVPLAEGGGNEITNLRTLCDSCNLGKGARNE